MKSIIISIFLSPLFFKAQNILNTIDFEIGGSSALYCLGIGTHFKIKDSTKIGFRFGAGYYPMIGIASNSKNFVPSLQFFYSHPRFLNGKSTFRVGTTIYFIDSYSSSGNDPNNGLSFSSYSPPSIFHSFNIGGTYNVLKKSSKLSLNLGLDCIIAFRDLNSNHIDVPVIPWPIIQYGIKF